MYWSIGTTSFRVGNHIEKNIILLNTLKEFWVTHSEWNDSSQIEFYDLATKKNLVKGTASRKDKDARQITSGLVNLGLVDKRRNITKVGYALLNCDKTVNDLFLIDEDNFIYLKQFLKMQIGEIRPFVALIYLLEKLDYLTYNEFTYLLPICNNIEDVKQMADEVKLIRNGKVLFDSVIIEKILKNNRTLQVINNFTLKQNPKLQDFVELDMNRKSAKYSEPLLKVYSNLLYFYNHKKSIDISYFLNMKELFKELSQNLKTQYNSYFKLPSRIKDEDYAKLFNIFVNLPIMKSESIKAFNLEFSKIVHLCKWKSTLEDYADLNRRYFMLPNIIKYSNKQFELDILPKYLLKNIIDSLIEQPIIDDENLYMAFMQSDISLEEISKSLQLSTENVIPEIQKDYNVKNLSVDNLKSFIDDKKLEQMNMLIDKFFMPTQLIELFKNISCRNDNFLKGYANIDNDVTIPTIFEYITAIAWYHIGGRKGNILKFMNLKLDANLLPVTHAPGYFSDIIFNYQKTDRYNAHDLLLEVTLADSTGQRRMEMEPVSRHLINYKEANNIESYVVFIANELHKFVLSDFRGRKNYYYEINGKIGQGLKIISLSIEDICNVLLKNITYEQLYSIFDNAYNNNEFNDIEWYDKCIKGVINAI